MKLEKAGDSRVRVFYVIDSLAIGGIQRNFLDIVQRTRDRIDYEICCIRRAGALAPAFEALGVRIHVLGAPSGTTVGLLPPLVRLCRARGADIVHANNWGAIEAVFAARIARVPAVLYAEHGPEARSPRRRLWGRKAAGAVAQAVVAVSNAAGDYLRTTVGVRADKIRVVRNGVDVEHFRPAADRDRLRRWHGLEPDALLIGGVGRLDAVKCYDVLIAAFADLARRRPDARLVLVGDGPERERLQDEIRARSLADRAWITGMRDDIAEWLGMMDVFAHVALSEGLSNAVLQAMATELPVVATRVAANAEIVVDGVTGRLVPVGATEALAEALVAYCADPAMRSAHGGAGRQRVESGFSARHMVNGYRAVYSEIFGAP